MLNIFPMGNTNFSLWGMGNLKTNIPQYSPQWGILGINPSFGAKIQNWLFVSLVSVWLWFQKSKIQKPITFLGGRLKLFSLGQQLKFFDLATLNAVFALPSSASHRSIIFLVRHLFLIHVFRSTPPTIIVVSPSLIICEQVFSSLLQLRSSQGFHPLTTRIE